MCGIWFSLGFPTDRAHLDKVAHRGPDGAGWRVFESRAGPVALGHRRLSIIDLSEAAAQPMEYADGRYWVTYNGEIYNYIELRAELAAAGHRFRTQSDTEVLLAAYAHWGEAALDRLVGMFAFVLWDVEGQVAFAARDRFGIKPLYLFATPRGVAFGSEIKQFVGLPGFAARLNIARAYDFCPPVSWIIPTKRFLTACGNFKAANASSSTFSVGAPAKLCRCGAGMAFSNQARSTLTSARRADVFVNC